MNRNVRHKDKILYIMKSVMSLNIFASAQVKVFDRYRKITVVVLPLFSRALRWRVHINLCILFICEANICG